MILTCEEMRFPNGDPYLELWVGKEKIGIVTKTENGGLLAHGRRKPVATFKEAAKQLLDSKMNNCMKEHAKWHRLLQHCL